MQFIYILFLMVVLQSTVYVMSAEVKQFLHSWCGKQKTSPNYDFRVVGSKIRQRFMCEVSMHTYKIKTTFL